ncbi:MAG TPA: hypothetical protein VN884_08510 [Candidatus Sulfotelmatobacter sp.]|jgi:hypothetical protein|nr:hypothetical protein [Candidatus Sulfotelmatobacter sp.]
MFQEASDARNVGHEIMRWETRQSEIIGVDVKVGIVETMDLTRHTESVSRRNIATRFVLPRMLVLFLLLAVPGLSTIAKDSIYLPQSNAAHFINKAAKMKLADVAVTVIAPQPAEPLVGIVLPQPEIRVERQAQLGAPPIPKVSLSICLRHRSPPFILA